MCNFLKSWLLIMAQHVLFSAAEQNIIPIDRYGNITHERDSWSDWCTDTDTTMSRCSTHKTKATDEGQNVLHADDSDRWRWKRSTCRRVTDEGQNVLHADDSDRWRWKRSTCRRQAQTKFKTFYTQTTATDDAGNVRRADDSHRQSCKRWRWYRRLTTLTQCPFKKQQ